MGASLSQQNFSKRQVAIVGANGFSGIELARLLLSHPTTHLAACFARDPKWHISQEIATGAENTPCFPLEELEARANTLDGIFFATPADVSLDLIGKLSLTQAEVAAGKKGPVLIDLSGAFRLSADELKTWYPDASKTAPTTKILDLLLSAHYGLSPWNNSALGANTTSGKTPVLSNPGCYATSVLMAILPLLNSRGPVIDPATLAIDAKSGTSGAGRSAQERLMFTEVFGECTPYRVGRHQHLPEIIRHTDKITGTKINPFFSTSLLPVKRGITTTLFAKPNARLAGKTNVEILHEVDRAFQEAYARYPLVKFGSLEQSSASDRMLTSLKHVVGSGRTHVAYTVQNGKIYLFSAIDNLLKGAASQAIENWNVMNGLAPETGLTSPNANNEGAL